MGKENKITTASFQLTESQLASLLIIASNSQKQLVIAQEHLIEFLKDKASRPEHLQDDETIMEHLNLHKVLLDDVDVIIGEAESVLEELYADQKHEQKPSWEQ